MQEYARVCKSIQVYCALLFLSVLLIFQDLTRLKVPIAYLPHMFEDALRERRGGTPATQQRTLVEPTSSFDQEVERSDAMPRMNRRGSSGR